MNCLPCFNKDDDEATDPPPPPKKDTPAQIEAVKGAAPSTCKAQTFNFRELAMATKNFRQECLLGEGGFGRVFKGKLQSSGKVVAVKQLDRNGTQGNKEFLVEVLMLSLIQHANLVRLVGYCADGDQRLLVYEYLPMGSLENQLFGEDPDKKPIDWFTRMKIAAGVANGLEYLHDKANPPIIYRDLKPSNILLDENFEPKLSDFGLAKLGAGGGKIHPTSRVMGTYGYSAPEYSSGGELTLKSDIYSFGVVLLELLTGRKAIDTTRPNDEQNLVTWAQPIFRDPKRYPDLADPKLNKEFPVTSLNQAVGICAMCLQEEPFVRPLISDVVAALSFLTIPQPIATPPPASVASPTTYVPPSEQKMEYETEVNSSEAPQSEQGSSHYDDRSSGDIGSTESEEESFSEPIEGSSSNFSAGEKDSSSHSQYSGRESERQGSDKRHSFDNSEERNSYLTDTDSGGEDTNYDDAETRELDDPDRSVNSIANYSLYSVQSTDSSMKSEYDAGNTSSKRGRSRASSPTKYDGSRRRKPVVTFKEPTLSGKKNGTIKPKEEIDSSANYNADSKNNSQTVIPVSTDAIQQQHSSSSSSESSSESEDEKKSLKHKEVTRNVPQNNGDQKEAFSINYKNEESHRVFDQPHKEGPVLRHLKTR